MSLPSNDKELAYRYRREFTWVTIILCIVTALAAFFADFSTVNNAQYAQALRLTMARPALPEIVIIVIDDKSLTEIGRWPWRRFIHAQLLKQLNKAKVVGFDLTFLDESAYPNDDKAFAEAIESHGRVVLSNFISTPQDITPVDPFLPFASKANQLGYINIPIDSDGLVRRVQLSTELPNNTLALHFSLAMLMVAQENAIVERYSRPNTEGNVDESHHLIPFVGPPSHFQTVSYTDVLNRRIDENFFNDKYVIIGAWATGLGDKFPTPTSSQSLNMSGVEILTNILQANLQNNWIEEISPSSVALFSLAWVLLYCFLLNILSPRSAVIAGVLLGGLSLVTSLLVMGLCNLFIPLAPTLLGLAMSYPLWTWRAQELALSQMDREIDKLNKERPLLSMEDVHPYNPSLLQGRNSFNVHLVELRSALARVRNLRQFISDSFNDIPYVAAVFDNESKLTFATEIANNYFADLGYPNLSPEITLKQLLDIMLENPEKVATIMTSLWSFCAPKKQLSPLSQQEVLPDELEFTDKLGKDIILKFANTHTSSGELSGFIITLIDISTIRIEERQREETVRFLSHDMRAPQSAIQALIKMQQNPATALPNEQFLKQIGNLSQNTLTLVDDFLFLARANNTDYQFIPVYLIDIIHNSIENFWGICKSRQIKIVFNPTITVGFILADESLLTRVFNNLIDNAIKYGKDGMQITIDIQKAENNWLVTIADQGIGIAEENFTALFKTFSQLPQIRNKAVSGLGLGLAFVHTVLAHHKGTITLESQENQGTTFYIRLPIIAEEEES